MAKKLKLLSAVNSYSQPKTNILFKFSGAKILNPLLRGVINKIMSHMNSTRKK